MYMCLAQIYFNPSAKSIGACSDTVACTKITASFWMDVLETVIREYTLSGAHCILGRVYLMYSIQGVATVECTPLLFSSTNSNIKSISQVIFSGVRGCITVWENIWALKTEFVMVVLDGKLSGTGNRAPTPVDMTGID